MRGTSTKKKRVPLKTEITLYHYWRSSCSWRVRWALEIKKIPYNSVAVNLLEGEEKNQDFLKKNPAGYVPALLYKNKVLAESLPIMEWLEEKFPEPTLYFGDSFMRAKIRQLAETINSGTQPLQNLAVMKKFSSDEAAQKSWSAHWTERGLNVYENILDEFHKASWKFSCGSEPSAADLCLIPQCYNAARFNMNFDAFPTIKKIYEHALTTEACQASAPDRFKP